MYFRYLDVSIRSQMQYRASFIMQSIGHFLVTAFEFLAIYALFGRFGNLKGWSLAEIAVFYGMINIAFSINDSLTRGFDISARLIKSGELDRILLRPRSTVLQLMGFEFTLRRVGRFSQSLFVLIFGAAHLGIQWHAGKIILMLWAICGGSCLFVGLIIAQATLSFWTTESLEIMNTLTYGGIETGQYPIAIYLPWFRKFFTFVVPLACVNYFPVVAILEKPDPLGSPVWFQHLSPVMGVFFLVLGLLLWRIGLRHYSSTGS